MYCKYVLQIYIVNYTENIDCTYVLQIVLQFLLQICTTNMWCKLPSFVYKNSTGNSRTLYPPRGIAPLLSFLKLNIPFPVVYIFGCTPQLDSIENYRVSKAQHLCYRF